MHNSSITTNSTPSRLHQCKNCSYHTPKWAYLPPLNSSFNWDSRQHLISTMFQQSRCSRTTGIDSQSTPINERNRFNLSCTKRPPYVQLDYAQYKQYASPTTPTNKAIKTYQCEFPLTYGVFNTRPLSVFHWQQFNPIMENHPSRIAVGQSRQTISRRETIKNIPYQRI